MPTHGPARNFFMRDAVTVCQQKAGLVFFVAAFAYGAIDTGWPCIFLGVAISSVGHCLYNRIERNGFPALHAPLADCQKVKASEMVNRMSDWRPARSKCFSR